MNRKIDPLFRVSFIVQGAESLDNALRAVNGLTIHPPLTEPYQEVPIPIVKKQERAKPIAGRESLSNLILTRLTIGTAPSTDLVNIAKEYKFSPGNVSKAARNAGGVFNPTNKTWSLKKQ